jgi:hypothetical protein
MRGRFLCSGFPGSWSTVGSGIYMLSALAQLDGGYNNVFAANVPGTRSTSQPPTPSLVRIYPTDPPPIDGSVSVSLSQLCVKYRYLLQDAAASATPTPAGLSLSELSEPNFWGNPLRDIAGVGASEQLPPRADLPAPTAGIGIGIGIGIGSAFGAASSAPSPASAPPSVVGVPVGGFPARSARLASVIEQLARTDPDPSPLSDSAPTEASASGWPIPAFDLLNNVCMNLRAAHPVTPCRACVRRPRRSKLSPASRRPTSRKAPETHLLNRTGFAASCRRPARRQLLLVSSGLL